MLFGTRQFKNEKQRGYLTFNTTGKKVVLNEKELKEFKAKVKLWQLEAIERGETTEK